MLPKNVLNILLNRKKWCNDDTISEDGKSFIISDESKAYFLDEIGIKNRNSAFISYYTVVALTPKGNGEELLTLDKIIEEYDTQEYEGVEAKEMERFLKLSSVEGEGSYFYDKNSDAIYDVNWGQEPDLAAGTLKPKFDTFYEFLEWYYKGIK